ncbi:MAG: IS1595 family transposase [Desulfomonile tiedjei]|nr:IS1595 family transposase [Desulfomonile tiedjei]
MKNSIISHPRFHNEEAAYAYVEGLLWPKGPVCPHCGATKRIGKLHGKSYRKGLYKCYVCRKQFTVKIGTIFEDSHVPLDVWVSAIYLIAASKKGISANQLHRTLGVTLKTAWFMGHRIREAMRSGDLAPFGANGGSVESDETFIWNEPGAEIKPGTGHKRKVLSLIDRDSRSARSFVVDSINAKTLVPILKENIDKEARVLTDEGGQYRYLKDHFADHQVVCHRRGEYVSAEDKGIHVNCAEGFFSIFKRGMKGVYQHCKKEHLHRYLAEFDFRYNNRCGKGIPDTERAAILLKGVAGRRLTYQTTN